ncbi:hypothetical protein [uncultured Tateyamaria sp.]|uniref:DUF6902 family protein n=1 Tax=Tateyamaria sp. 1078 TaxID=3417464 RepID=UPI002635F603|nr:hypothetical protein [uncultured Tateyamaria sp.]
MSNIISLNVPPRRLRLAERTPALIGCFAKHRRIRDDVFWLKENAELLNILECTGQRVTPDALVPLAGFYQSLPERLTFFPQYYRFLLSIGLDLEDLGLPGEQMQHLCETVARQGLADAELSDLQRAEARRLLARRGVRAAADAGLDDRLRAFTERSATFALPNKKAAYELTHIVFYLSEYGRRDPQLSQSAICSLEYAGILAYLDQNMDLLAEICVALRQARQKPCELWENAVRDHLQDYRVEHDADASLSDGYHEYLVSLWAVAVMGHDDSGAVVPQGRAVFAPRAAADSALRPMSAVLMSLADARQPHWHNMRDAVLEAIPPEAAAIIAAAESAPRFEPFFETFARAGTPTR